MFALWESSLPLIHSTNTSGYHAVHPAAWRLRSIITAHVYVKRHGYTLTCGHFGSIPLMILWDPLEGQRPPCVPSKGLCNLVSTAHLNPLQHFSPWATWIHFSLHFHALSPNGRWHLTVAPREALFLIQPEWIGLMLCVRVTVEQGWSCRGLRVAVFVLDEE